MLVPALAQAASEAKAAGSAAGGKRQREPSADDELAGGQDVEKPGAVNIKSEAHILQHSMYLFARVGSRRGLADHLTCSGGLHRNLVERARGA